MADMQKENFDLRAREKYLNSLKMGRAALVCDEHASKTIKSECNENPNVNKSSLDLLLPTLKEMLSTTIDERL
jgi:hypothetical protein